MLDLADIMPAKGQFYYLATPYSKWEHGLDDACDTAAELAGDIMRRGVAVYSPIAHSHTIARAADIDPLSHVFWMPMDEPLFHASCGLIVAKLPGWRESRGIGEEIEWCRRAGKVRYLITPGSMRIEPLP